MQGFAPNGSQNKAAPTKSPVEEFLDQHAGAKLFSTVLKLSTKDGLIVIDLPAKSVPGGQLTIGAVDPAIKNSGQDLTWCAHYPRTARSLGRPG